MLRIYDSKEQVPEAVLEHYSQRSDGKWEPQIEGINSVGGLIAKRDELLEKVREIPTLKTKIADLEGQETLPAGKIAVDKKEFERVRSEHEAYSKLGKIDELKPKVEGYDDLKQKDEARTKDETYRAIAKAAGFNEDRFARLAAVDGLEATKKTVDENGKAVEKYFVKSKDANGAEVETSIDDYIKTSPNFAPFADSLTATGGTGQSGGGTKVIRQGQSTPATPTLETEIQAARASGVYGL